MSPMRVLPTLFEIVAFLFNPEAILYHFTKTLASHAKIYLYIFPAARWGRQTCKSKKVGYPADNQPFLFKMYSPIDNRGFGIPFSDRRSYPLPGSARSELGADRDTVKSCVYT